MKRNKTWNTARWHVRLGAGYARPYTHSGVEQEAGVRLVGSITKAAQIGALARTDDGRYVQVNGDHISPLSHGQVARAVRLAEEALKLQQRHEARERQRAAVPTVRVTVKRRRLIGAE